MKAHVGPSTVRPDWATFESSWQKISNKSKRNNRGYSWQDISQSCVTIGLMRRAFIYFKKRGSVIQLTLRSCRSRRHRTARRASSTGPWCSSSACRVPPRGRRRPPRTSCKRGGAEGFRSRFCPAPTCPLSSWRGPLASARSGEGHRQRCNRDHSKSFLIKTTFSHIFIFLIYILFGCLQILA